MAKIRPNAQGVAKGTNGHDTITGNSFMNIMTGRNGNDVMRGAGNNDVLDGGAGDDTMYGDAGNDLISGGLGMDTLTGGAGKDLFGFDTKIGPTNIDTITDFDVKKDSFILARGSFSKLPKGDVFKAKAFYTGAAAHDADDRIIYNKETGALYYDADGAGAKEAQQFAQIKAGLALTYKDFLIL